MSEADHKALANLPGHFLALNNYLDHTLLSPLAGEADIIRLCDEALLHGFRAVCLSPKWTRLAARHLSESGIDVAVVVDFPLGASSYAQRRSQIEEAVSEGAGEIDLVAPLHLIAEGNWNALFEDLATLSKLTGSRSRLKVILEIGFFERAQVMKSAQICGQVGCFMVKTSTGMLGAKPVEVSDIQVLSEALSDYPLTGIKASGGIKNAAQAWSLIQSGAERLGTSSAIKLISS